MNGPPPTQVNQHRTRIKICGLTRDEDVDAACTAGVDAIGFICYPPSPRHVTVDLFKRLSDRAGPFVTVVAVVVDPDADYLRELVEHVGIDVIQFHGNESADFCASWARPWIKAARVKPGLDLNASLVQAYQGARGWLVDAYRKDAVGGTGETFDWQVLDHLDHQDRQRLILAGGLGVENIQSAIKRVRPFAVDISSGVETSPGVKDASRINDMMSALREADQLVTANT